MVVEDSPLCVANLVSVGEWCRQLSAFDWVDGDDVVFGVGLGTSSDDHRRFYAAQVSALQRVIQTDAPTAVAAVAEIVPRCVRLFVHSFERELALWQNEPLGPLVLLEFVPRDETQSFPDHHKVCPFGHPMPGENKLDLLDDHFRVSEVDWFEGAVVTYTAQLTEFFALPDQPARSAWLDRRDRGLVGGTDAQRLDPLSVPGREFRRCTGHCGYYHWNGTWLRDPTLVAANQTQ